LGFKKNLAAERRQETNILNNIENGKWIENYVVIATTVATLKVEETETTIKYRKTDMQRSQGRRLSSREPGEMFEMILDAIGYRLSDLPCSDHDDHGEDNEDTEQGTLCNDDKRGWVLRTMLKMVHLRRERFRQKQMKLEDLPRPGSGDEASHFRDTDKM
jgi:hypothetical protein